MRARVMSILVSVAVVALTGCGGPGSAPDPQVGPAPEAQRTSAAAVATGLTNIQAITNQIASTTGTDNPKAGELAEQIEPQWSPIEGTVKANDPDAYIAFEDAFAVLEDAVKKGDAASATKGSESATASARAYLAKYPG